MNRSEGFLHEFPSIFKLWAEFKSHHLWGSVFFRKTRNGLSRLIFHGSNELLVAADSAVQPMMSRR